MRERGGRGGKGERNTKEKEIETRIVRRIGYTIPTPSEYRNRVFSEREGAEQEESNGDHHRGCEEEKEERRGRRETERTSSACPDIANASEVSTERRRNNWHSARTFDRGTKGRRHGGNDDARGGCGMDARWHAPVHCRHIRHGVMAFFSTYGRRTICALRTYVRIRSYLNRRSQLHFWNGVRVRPSIRPFVRSYVCECRA